MSDKTAKPTEVVVDDASDDDLIHVPTGQSRLRYLATIGLVLFLLIIFVVADLFQTTMTGGQSREDAVYLTWEDPVSGETENVLSSEFEQTYQFLSMVMGTAYAPPRMIFRDYINEPPLRDNDVNEEDTAGFLIWEDLAEDAGVAISDEEHAAGIKRTFQTNANVRGFMANARLSKDAFRNGMRRIQRVAKIQTLLMSTQRVPSSEGAIEQWQEDRPDYKFDLVSVPTEGFVAQAKDETPGDDELLEWFHGLQPFQQQRLFNQPRVVYEAAYIDLDAETAFDGAALLAAFPAAEGTDVEQLTSTYYNLNQTLRFMKPQEPEAGDGEDGEGDDAAEPQETTKPEPFDFEEVKDRARTESELFAAMGSLLAEMQDAATAGEEFDFLARATELGLTADKGSDEGVTRVEIPEIDGWGSNFISGQLSFAAEGSFVPRVVISENAMTIARAVTKIEASEPPFEEIRDEVIDMWAKDKAAELAAAALDGVREALAARPEDVELADWNPVIEKAALKELAEAAEYTFYERPALERGEMADEQTPAERFIRTQATIYDLEDGQVGPAIVSQDKSTAYLVRFDSKVSKPGKEIAVTDFEGYRARTIDEQMREFARTSFRGDSEWLQSRTKFRFPVKEEAEARRAAEEAAE